ERRARRRVRCSAQQCSGRAASPRQVRECIVKGIKIGWGPLALEYSFEWVSSYTNAARNDSVTGFNVKHLPTSQDSQSACNQRVERCDLTPERTPLMFL